MGQNTKRAADNIRILAASMVEKAKSGHPGGAMGGADFINVLYSEFMEYDPSDASWAWRDRFFLDPGHMSPMLYSVLCLAGFYTTDDLKQFRQWGSVTPGHPEVDLAHGVENTSGPLGQGHAMAVGAAIVERFLCAQFGEWMAHKTYAFISDGGIQEEVSQGAGRIAGHLGLSNLVMFYDANNIQLSTTVDEVTSEDVPAKYRAWGWRVIEIDGNDAAQIRSALAESRTDVGRPTLIIGHTVMGLGAKGAQGESFENKVSTHGQPLSAAGADIQQTVQNLGGDPGDPFALFPEAVALYAARREELLRLRAEKAAAEKAWRAANPELAATLDGYLSGEFPSIDYSKAAIGAGAATRNASAAVLGLYAGQIGNMIVASADLSNSDKTDGFLKHTKPIVRGDFSGRFLQPGVSELTMACLCNGMALHGGVIPACGTFFVFSDYMKPAVRLAALMRLRVVWVWSHDSFRVGEDGPTHQPVEHEAQIRLLEQLHNHQGEPSVVVMRPADSGETLAAWDVALRDGRPAALLLSRQNVPDLAAASGDRAAEAWKGLSLGAYVVADDPQAEVLLVANGSEVSTLAAGAELLRAEGIRVRIVSAPSEGVFRRQSAAYQAQVLPAGMPRYGLTSGLPVTLRSLVGDAGHIHGLNHFGYSAPFKVLDEKFGFTAETVLREVKEMLGK